MQKDWLILQRKQVIMMGYDFLTLDDVEVKNKVVLARVDINCPIDPATGLITNDERIKLHAATTLKELRDKGAKTVVLSHQGRPGDNEFISLQQHAELLKKYLGNHIQFVDDIFGSNAKEHIKKMNPGDILVLENVRFFSEETLERPADVQAHCILVKALAAVSDLFVNDAFAAIHRSQPSLVGFGEMLPTVAGRVVEKEIAALQKILVQPQRPIVYLLGGVKVKESLKVIKNLMKQNQADVILTGGILGNLFLAAKGYDLGPISLEVLQGKEILPLLPQAKELIEKYGDKIETPVDVAVKKQEERIEVRVAKLPTPYIISDIGRETVGRYSKILEDAKTIVINSPMGRFEIPGFEYGTYALLEKVSCENAYTVVGGGHSAKVVADMGIAEKFSHVSIGGRATLYYLSGEKAPVMQMLQKAKQRVK
ncbi:phosphoglycerate kinase [Candidatus Woesearchaeota archaeon]|nr:phosphoglycerate kinase [Candidatus Woesearchaeota archaeon]